MATGFMNPWQQQEYQNRLKYNQSATGDTGTSGVFGNKSNSFLGTYLNLLNPTINNATNQLVKRKEALNAVDEAQTNTFASKLMGQLPRVDTQPVTRMNPSLTGGIPTGQPKTPLLINAGASLNDWQKQEDQRFNAFKNQGATSAFNRALVDEQQAKAKLADEQAREARRKAESSPYFASTIGNPLVFQPDNSSQTAPMQLQGGSIAPQNPPSPSTTQTTPTSTLTPPATPTASTGYVDANGNPVTPEQLAQMTEEQKAALNKIPDPTAVAGGGA